MLGEVTEERLKVLREADWIIREEVLNHGLYNEIWQVFGVLLPTKSVGVMGDQRTYQNAIAVRAVTSEDGMTADWARLPYDLLAIISQRIVNEVPGSTVSFTTLLPSHQLLSSGNNEGQSMTDPKDKGDANSEQSGGESRSADKSAADKVAENKPLS